MPLDHIAGLLIGDALANVAVALWLSRGRSVSPGASTLVIGVQMLLLTALLELTGGPSDPFSVVYILQIAVAALTIGAPWATFLAALATVSYGVLIYWHLHELVPTHHD